MPPLPPKGAAAQAAAEVGEARVAAAEVAPREVALVAHLERLCALYISPISPLHLERLCAAHAHAP